MAGRWSDEVMDCRDVMTLRSEFGSNKHALGKVDKTFLGTYLFSNFHGLLSRISDIFQALPPFSHALGGGRTLKRSYCSCVRSRCPGWLHFPHEAKILKAQGSSKHQSRVSSQVTHVSIWTARMAEEAFEGIVTSLYWPNRCWNLAVNSLSVATSDRPLNRQINSTTYTRDEEQRESRIKIDFDVPPLAASRISYDIGFTAHVLVNGRRLRANSGPSREPASRKTRHGRHTPQNLRGERFLSLLGRAVSSKAFQPRLEPAAAPDARHLLIVCSTFWLRNEILTIVCPQTEDALWPASITDDHVRQDGLKQRSSIQDPQPISQNLTTSQSLHTTLTSVGISAKDPVIFGLGQAIIAEAEPYASPTLPGREVCPPLATHVTPRKTAKLALLVRLANATTKVSRIPPWHNKSLRRDWEDGILCDCVTSTAGRTHASLFDGRRSFPCPSPDAAAAESDANKNIVQAWILQIEKDASGDGALSASSMDGRIDHCLVEPSPFPIWHEI
ncbi:uncharacterized protein MYCFIDRAFT_177793 [Pseudocercospora fijiensis CIRAD86]|uniref:Uncharacterized protein n=1 Tax=Pseudocercospora fijiensis (strain CIRAD86) TaxID=383855 RepID=M3ANV2_PSEFD|nr:uncharacterized protein MYCFIDRAFT_177793 [Pseudocercospora fijiensis CIRAD86]EME79142.1 hypothetical protein MYCFIDRAFT_177793 [Pseudocercospora fijiensis CIRAD86]